MPDKTIVNLLPNYLINSQLYYVMTTDMEGCYTFVNDCFKTRFNFLFDDFIGKHSTLTFHKDDIPKCNEVVRACFLKPETPIKITLRKPDNKEGDFFYTDWEFSVLFNTKQEMIGILCIGHDISESERNSRKAKDFAQKLDSIINQMEDCFYALNHQWEVIRVNEYAEKFLNKKQEDILEKKFGDIFPELYLQNYSEYFEKSMKEYVVNTFELYRTAQNTWHRVIIQPSIEGLNIIFKDITKEKQAAEEITLLNYKLKALYESGEGASTFLDKSFKIIYTNRAVKKVCKIVFGKIPKVGDEFFDFVFPELKEILQEYLQQALKGKHIETEVKVHETWWHFVIYPVYDDEKNIMGISHTARNITKERKAEIESKRIERNLEILADNFPEELIALIDKNLKILYTAGDFYRNIKYTGPKNIIGYELKEFLPKGVYDEMFEYLESIWQGASFTYEVNYRNKTFFNKLKPIKNKKGEIESFVMILVDITERKQREKKIIQQNQKLRTIAWKQSHEVRAPLANILGLVNLMKYAESGEYNTYIKYLEEATKKLDDIIYKIVEYTGEIP